MERFWKLLVAFVDEVSSPGAPADADGWLMAAGIVAASSPSWSQTASSAVTTPATSGVGSRVGRQRLRRGGRLARRDGVDHRRRALRRAVGQAGSENGAESRRVGPGRSSRPRAARLAAETLVEGITRAGVPTRRTGRRPRPRCPAGRMAPGTTSNRHKTTSTRTRTRPARRSSGSPRPSGRSSGVRVGSRSSPTRERRPGAPGSLR